MQNHGYFSDKRYLKAVCGPFRTSLCTCSQSQALDPARCRTGKKKQQVRDGETDLQQLSAPQAQHPFPHHCLSTGVPEKEKAMLISKIFTCLPGCGVPPPVHL